MRLNIDVLISACPEDLENTFLNVPKSYHNVGVRLQDHFLFSLSSRYGLWPTDLQNLMSNPSRFNDLFNN